MQTTGRVKGILEADDSYTAVVDVIGIGAGVVDRLRELHMKVLAFNASKASKAKDSTREFGFANRRREARWTMRQALDLSGNPDYCLPDDEMLLGDLSAPHWEVTSSGRIKVEGKDVFTELAELVEPEHTALLLIDMQHDFVDPGGLFATLGVDAVVKCIDAAVRATEAVVANANPRMQAENWWTIAGHAMRGE